jgi:hypothetical protein
MELRWLCMHDRTRWWKILNPDYSQKEGRAELFERRSG